MSKQDRQKPSADAEKARIFVGIEAGMETIADLGELVESMQPTARANELQVRWVSPSTYHLTLAFLGWCQREVIPAVRDAIADAVAGHKGFSIGVEGVGAFPSAEAASVLWAGIRDEGKGLSSLATDLRRSLEPLGFEPDPRPFHAHLTLGRLGEVSNVQKLVLPFSEQVCRKSFVSRILLYESFLKSTGSQYEILASWPLEAPSE